MREIIENLYLDLLDHSGAYYLYRWARLLLTSRETDLGFRAQQGNQARL